MTQVTFSLMRRGLQTPQRNPELAQMYACHEAQAVHRAELSHHPEPCIYVSQRTLLFTVSDNNVLPLDALHVQGNVLL